MTSVELFLSVALICQSVAWIAVGHLDRGRSDTE